MDLLEGAFSMNRFLLLGAILLQTTAIYAGDHAWPQFRGPDGQGHGPEGSRFPTRWSEQQNIAWKVELPGLGWSSPVVDGQEIWLTTAMDAQHSLRAICIDAQTGDTRHSIEVFHPDELVVKHERNSHATPTPVIGEGHVFVHFGTYGTAAIARKTGELVWKNQEHRLKHQWGPGSSPIQHDQLLIFNCDGMEKRYVVALDTKTGETVWRTERSVPIDKGGHFRKAFSTPLITRQGDRQAVISTGANQVSAYEPQTGQELWTHEFYGYAAVTRPVLSQGLLFVTTGYGDHGLLAIHSEDTRRGKAGDLAWSTKNAAPIIPSPIAVGESLYVVNDNGILQCLHAETGKLQWRQRLAGNFAASPTYIGGRLYFHNDRGETFVIQPDEKEYRQVAVNSLNGNIQASLAAVDDALLLRTESHLYRIEVQE